MRRLKSGTPAKRTRRAISTMMTSIVDSIAQMNAETTSLFRLFVLCTLGGQFRTITSNSQGGRELLVTQLYFVGSDKGFVVQGTRELQVGNLTEISAKVRSASFDFYVGNTDGTLELYDQEADASSDFPSSSLTITWLPSVGPSDIPSSSPTDTISPTMARPTS